jgi:hypothetical protein
VNHSPEFIDLEGLGHHDFVLPGQSVLYPLYLAPNDLMGLKGDTFRNRGEHQVECDGRTPEDSIRNLPPVLPTVAESMEKEYVCARAR